jgi:hypothetical protein
MLVRHEQWQVVSLNLMESLVYCIAVPLSLLTGWLAGLMSQTFSFLQFTSRCRSFSFQGEPGLDWLGSLLVILSRFAPTCIANDHHPHKQEQSRSYSKPIWQRFYLDFILLSRGFMRTLL